MKTRNLLAAVLITALAFTSCSKNDPSNDSNIVRFNTSVSGLSKASINRYTGVGEFENGDVWGIYGKIATPESWPLNNTQYTLGTSKLYWEDISEDKPVTFYAYYPAVNTISDPTAYQINLLTTPESERDLLVATPVTASKGEPVNLNFKHVMHHLDLAFHADGTVPGVDDMFAIEFTMLNMKTTAKVNLLTGEVDPAQTTGLADYPKADIFGNLMVVAPQDLVPGTDWFKIELAGHTYTAKVPAQLISGTTANPTRLESGKRLRVNLVLKYSPGTGKTAVAVSTSPISGWEDQGGDRGTDKIDSNN